MTVDFDIQEAKRRYEAGERLGAIAGSLHVHDRTLAKAFRSAGVTIHPPARRPKVWDPAVIEGMKARYEAGDKLEMIAAPLEVSMATVAKKLREAGVKVRSKGNAHGIGYKGNPRRPHKEFPEEKITEAVALYEAQSNFYEIGNFLGCSALTVSRILKSRGVVPRKAGEMNALRAQARAVGGLPCWYMTTAKRGASDRGFEFNVSESELWSLFLKQGGKCVLSGLPIKMGTVNRKRKEMTASLDRIDSTRGYVEGNVQWVHKVLNQAKMDLPNEDFIILCNRVAQANPRLFGT